MEANYARRRSALAGVVLLATFQPALAAPEATDHDGSTLIVTASDAAAADDGAPLGVSELVVHDAEAADADAAAAPAAARGTLTVVANASRQAAPLVVARDSAVQPATSIEAVEGNRPQGGITSWQPPAGHAAVRNGATLTDRLTGWGGARRNTPQRSLERQRTAAPAARRRREPAPPQPFERESLEASTSVAPQGASTDSAATPAGAAPVDPSLALVAEAHQLSLKARSQSDFTHIVKLCAEASQRGLEGDGAAYCKQLSSWALNRRGQLRAEEGTSELAVADFRAALDQDATNWRALHNRGVSSAQNGQFAEAFDDICRVIELKPEFAKAYSNRATLYVQAADFENALADYDRALERDASLTQALVGRGRVRHMQGQLEAALADLTAAIAQAPKDAEVVCSRADLLADLGRYNDALADYARAIELNPRFEHAFRNGAWLLATCPDDSVRDAQGAIDGANAALRCGYGERHAALDTLAAAQANAGKFKEALATIAQAIAVAPAELKPAYEARQELYQAHQPFRTKPVGEVQTAEYVEASDDAATN